MNETNLISYQLFFFLLLTGKEKAVVDDGEEVGVGHSMGRLSVEQIKHTLQAAVVH